MSDDQHIVFDQIIEMSDDISEIAKALPKAQSAMGEVFKNANNPAFKSKYADLGAVVEAVLPALNGVGIALLQPTTGLRNGHVQVATMLLHESGQWVRCVMAITLAKQDAHGIGSAVTYGRRFGLQAMSGVAPTDDDGNASSGPRQHHQQQQRQPEGPSAAAQYAAAQLRQAKTKDEFSHFWNSQKDGLKANLPEGDYQHVVRVMQSEAKRFAEPANSQGASKADSFPGDQNTPFDEAA